MVYDKYPIQLTGATNLIASDNDVNDRQSKLIQSLVIPNGKWNEISYKCWGFSLAQNPYI